MTGVDRLDDSTKAKDEGGKSNRPSSTEACGEWPGGEAREEGYPVLAHRSEQWRTNVPPAWSRLFEFDATVVFSCLEYLKSL